MNTDSIRRGLYDFRLRAATIEAVVAQGEAVIDEILPLLQDRNEGVRWSTIRILTEIGDTRAIGPLLGLLEQSKNSTDAAHALRSITGQDFGDSAADWRHWIMQDATRRNTAGANLLSDDELLAAATRELPATVSGESPAYSIRVSLPGGRTQEIWADFSATDPQGRPIVQLSTPCGQADPARYEVALKLNMTIPFGGIALASLDDTLCFAMVASYLRETVHAEDLAESIMSLARHGDSLERSLSNQDRF